MWYSSIDKFLWCSMELGSMLDFFCQTKLFVPNTRYNAFAFVMSGFSERESDTENDMPTISKDMLTYQIGKIHTLGLSKICDYRLPYTSYTWKKSEEKEKKSVLWIFCSITFFVIFAEFMKIITYVYMYVCMSACSCFIIIKKSSKAATRGVL